MASDTEGGDLTADGYWGQLRAWGFANAKRVTPASFTMSTPSGDIANVADPAGMNPEERAAVLNLIKKVHVSFDA